MAPLSTNIERILSYGGGVSIDATHYMSSNLERFASFAAASGATLIIRNSDKLMSSSMERIAAFGKGKVIFEFN